MMRRSVKELLREQQRSFERQLERKDEMIAQLLDRIQHPERTPIWREPPPPLDEWDGVKFEDGVPVYYTDASELDDSQQ